MRINRSLYYFFKVVLSFLDIIDDLTDKKGLQLCKP